MYCKKCSEPGVKNGRQSNGKQRFYCKNCKCSFQQEYTYHAYNESLNQRLIQLLCSGVGVNDCSRILKISKNTVIKRMLLLKERIKKPVLTERNQYYEMDEMRVVVGNKKNHVWLIYAINRYSRKVIDFVVGSRNKQNLATVLKSVLKLNPKQIFTDRLPAYRKLLPISIHGSQPYTTNRIERNNLTLRTHIKRLGRRTICFSKKCSSLEAHLHIYFWSRPF